MQWFPSESNNYTNYLKDLHVLRTFVLFVENVYVFCKHMSCPLSPQTLRHQVDLPITARFGATMLPCTPIASLPSSRLSGECPSLLSTPAAGLVPLYFLLQPISFSATTAHWPGLHLSTHQNNWNAMVSI